MNTYSDPLTLAHHLGQHDFGAGGDTHKLKGPAGYKGRVRHIELNKVTEAFTAVTTPAYIRIGDGSDADKYADMSCGTTAIDAVDGPAASELFNAEIAADEEPVVTFVAPTGGIPAGIGNVTVHIDWYK